MRRSTMVVAILATTIATASAAPNSGKSSREASFSKTQQSVARSAAGSSKPNLSPVADTKPRGASAFTSARNAAAPAPQPAPQTAPVRAERPRDAARTASTRSRSDWRRYASVRRAASRSRTVALTREVAAPEIARPGGQAAVAAPTGSIHGMVTAAAQRAGVDPALGHAVVKVESMYNARATGKGGYIGLMQLSYQTARGMGFRGGRQALYEPSANLQYGMRYLAEAVRKSGGNTCAAVSKYQGGHGVRGVTSAGAVYCAKVRRFMAAR